MGHQNPIVKAHLDGKREGRREIRVEVLTFLESKYLEPDVVRETPLAEQLLQMVRELSELMRA